MKEEETSVGKIVSVSDLNVYVLLCNYDVEIKVILYYFGGKYKSLGINSNCYTGILPNRNVPIGRKIYFITFSAYVLFTILFYQKEKIMFQ